MPIYDYKCTTCGERLEVEQSITEDSLTSAPGCPEGGDHTLKKVFHPVGISFKGSGFYKNDARGSSSKSTSGSDTATNGSGSTETKSDSASSATKSETKSSGSSDSGSKTTAKASAD